MRHASHCLLALALASGCVSTADKNQDGSVSVMEFCVTEAELRCDWDDNCLSDADRETHEECTEAALRSNCSYMEERCDFDEGQARDCITAMSAEVVTCEPEENTAQACLGAWTNCDYDHD